MQVLLVKGVDPETHLPKISKVFLNKGHNFSKGFWEEIIENAMTFAPFESDDFKDLILSIFEVRGFDISLIEEIDFVIGDSGI